MTHLAFLLHMHQPRYVDPASGVALLPWVRLHAARAYLDVARLLDEHGEVPLTVNFVPSLVEQLEAVAAQAQPADLWLDVARRPASSWTPEDRAFLVERYFSVAWNPNVESRPRYRELLEKRGRQLDPRSLPARAASFSDGELRDLTVLFHLAWLGFAAREGRPEIDELERKGKGYDEHDLAAVVEAGRAACARVLPLYRKLAARGQVELSASPYFHPIVPLLCDTDAARRALSSLPLPDRFAFPGDAKRQIAMGRDAHARSFGAAPAGMWPPEGSISPEAAHAYRDEGISWIASDEGNLFRSLELAASHGHGPARHHRGLLYQAFRFDGVDLVFRDRDISDRIGFRYAHGGAQEGVDDLLARVRMAGESARAAGVREPLVSVILDGENPWESYPGSGEPFLRALLSALSRPHRQVVPTAVGPFLAARSARHALPALHSGSWIDSDFHIWIGDPVKNRAWNLLGRARRRLERALSAGHASKAVDDARRALDAAEGSDWFWWFGEPFHSAEDALFDRLFRANLAAAFRALGEPPPAELDDPVSRGTEPEAVRPPRARISPTIDGRVSSYFEWIGAGRYEVPRGAAMAEQPVAREVHFGFDAGSLYLRVDAVEGAAARLCAAQVELAARLADRDLHLVAAAGEPAFRRAPIPDQEHDDRPVGRVACADLLELEVPFAALGAAPGDRLELVLRLRESGASGVVLARLPRDGHLELRVPDAEFDADNWLL